MTAPRSVLIVDDHPAFRAFARRLLDGHGFTVADEAGTGAGALEAAARVRPDVVVLDINLPDLDGFAVAERLARVPRPPAVVLVSTRLAADYGPRIDDSDALGFIAKETFSALRLTEVLACA